MPNQTDLPFLAEIDKQTQRQLVADSIRMQRANERAILKAHIKQNPITPHERLFIPKGIRLARFVSFSECRKCPYAEQDHSLNNKFGTDHTDPLGPTVPCICLKDYFK